MEATHIVSSFVSLGYLGLFCIAFAEKLIPVVPSYVMLMLLGMTVSDSTGLCLAVAATVLGSLAASIAWYAVGRILGERRIQTLVTRFGRYLLLRVQTYDRLAASYRRRRFLVTLIGQTIPVARIYLALPAGVLRLRLTSFAMAAGLGILIWNTPFLVLGYALREASYDPVDMGFRASVALVAAELFVLAILKLVGRRAAAHQRSA